MIRNKQETENVIDLTGPAGNAFALLGQADVLAKQLGLNSYDILQEMKFGDYEHLIQTFDKYFGEYVILER